MMSARPTKHVPPARDDTALVRLLLARGWRGAHATDDAAATRNDLALRFDVACERAGQLLPVEASDVSPVREHLVVSAHLRLECGAFTLGSAREVRERGKDGEEEDHDRADIQWRAAVAHDSRGDQE